MQKTRTSTGDAANQTRLGILTALSLASTLIYVFVLLVPTWRMVHVDRNLIGASLANQSVSQDVSGLWDALLRDTLLRSRSANAFRECLNTDDDYNATADGGPVSAKGKQPIETHLLEVLAGVVNASQLTEDHKSPGAHRGSGSGDRCWFLNMHWSMSEKTWALMTAAHQALLRCTRALFLLAVCLLLCYCVCLTCSLYACFASRLAVPCRMLLLIAHILTLSQLVALTILQDVSVRLAVARLIDLLAAAGFPDNCTSAVSGSHGVCSLVLFCILCLTSTAQMLLLVAPIAWEAFKDRRAHRRRKDHSMVAGLSAGQDATTGAAAAAAACGREDDEKTKRECDDTDDTNPLI